MATEIGRSLEEIDNKVKTLNKSLKESSDTTRELDKSLKLDPKNIDAAAKKMTVLQSTVGTATQKVALLRQKQIQANEAFNKGDLSAAEYKKIELAVLRAENELKRLNGELAKTQKMKLDKTAESFDKLTGKLGKLQSATQKVANVATAMLASLTAAATAFIMVGDELDDVSNKFNISAEKLQIHRHLYGKVTDDAKNYDKALSSMNMILGNIAKGSGAAHAEMLNRLGVSATDSAGNMKSAVTVYEEVMLALGALGDATEVASIATALFGDNGLNVADVAMLSNEQLAALNQELFNNGIISSESAAQAGAVADQLDNIKQQATAASAELLIALMPTIQSLVEFLQVTVIPILQGIANWFAGMSPAQQKFVFFLLMLIIILPKLIAIVTTIVGVIKAITIASYGAAGGVGAVSAASIPLQPILLAVAAAILVVVLLFAMLAGKSKDVTQTLFQQQQQLSGLQSTYDGMAADMNGTTSVVSNNTNTNIVEHNVHITAEGDTPISQETADLVADNLADRINESLGGKI